MLSIDLGERKQVPLVSSGKDREQDNTMFISQKKDKAKIGPEVINTREGPWKDG